MSKKLMFLALAVVVVGPVATGQAAELAHRWSFNGNLADSVGGQDAVIVDQGANNATLSDTQVTLAGGGKDASDYIDLPDGILSSLGDSVTIEVWATQLTIQNWSRVWDFGTSTAHNVFMSWTRGTTLAQDRVEWLSPSGNFTVDDTMAPYTLGTEFHIVCVFQPGSVTWYGAPADAVGLGAAQGTSQTQNLLSTLADTNCWLGRSQYGDNTANASYNEVRFWKGVLTAEELETLHELGPDRLNANIALRPSPANSAADVSRDTLLSWASGDNARTHDVYLGTSFADVGAATSGSPLGVLVGPGLDANSFDPGRLAFEQTYYWRVDEVGAAPGFTVFKGDIWSFTVEPYSYPIAGVTAEASSSNSDTSGPDKTVDGSGLDAAGLHSNDTDHMWLTRKGGTLPAWIQYTFPGVRKLDKMLVWNYNQALESIVGFGAKDVTVEYSADGATWETLGAVEFTQASGAAAYAANTTVDFGGVAARFVKLTIAGNWGGLLPQTGLSEVRFYAVPVSAREPQPAPGATAVNPQVQLSWRAGREAASHKVYLSDDQQAVADGTVAAVTVSAPEYETALMLDQAYYWKVTEVNDAEAINSWDSSVWSFTTNDFVAVDDFETYDDKDNRIFDSWLDGWDDPANGSVVGYNQAPFAEQTLVHGGKQSMPLAYENTAGVARSEATLTFASPQDWTQHGITTLVLFFRGQASNSPAPLYLKINDTKVSFNNGAPATALPLWKQWNVDLAATGASLQSVKSLTLGVEGSGAGLLFVDDIRLYAVAPAIVAPVDPGTTGLMALYAMEGNVQDTSGQNNHGAVSGLEMYDTGVSGQALVFNGTNTYVDLPLGSMLSTLTNITVATWVNFSAAGGGWQRVWDFGTGNTNYMFLAPHQTVAGPMTFAIRTTTVAEVRVVAPARLPTGWHHVTVTIDSATMRAQIYLDGVSVASNAVAVLPKDLGVTNQNWLGRSQYTADAYFGGMLDEFRIYNRVLSAGEVRYLAGDR